jgi:thiosulfate dehydrogenase
MPLSFVSKKEMTSQIRTVFTAQCALCHGAQGQGQKSGKHYVFPPLWGADSYNWGAGMHRLPLAAGFIKANMPLGQGGSLSDQQAWDVAAFINSQPRPQDPRFMGSVEETRKKYHDDDDFYGHTLNGAVLGAPTQLTQGTPQIPKASQAPR